MCNCNIDNNEVCEECCDHSDIDEDEFVCLICGKDLREDYISKAFDKYKNKFKYGD